jgi:ubiquinone/menaquinone biosynthesis C-methylase UbiE
VPTLRQAWEANARDWIRWAREPGHDSYWQFHRDAFFELLPPVPGALTLDLGCGEGRVARDLKARGHRVIGIDGSQTLVDAARAEDPSGEYLVADAAALPVDAATVDLVVSFMVLHDVDDLDAAVRECARVLRPGGRMCAATVHPLNSAGHFKGESDKSPYVITGSYLSEFRYEYAASRHGLGMTFHSRHRPLETMARAFEQAGLLIEAIREPPARWADPMAGGAKRWQRVPLFLHLRAVKRACAL